MNGNKITDGNDEEKQWREFLDALCGRPKGAPHEPIKPELSPEAHSQYVDWLFPETERDLFAGLEADEPPPVAS